MRVLARGPTSSATKPTKDGPGRSFALSFVLSFGVVTEPSHTRRGSESPCIRKNMYRSLSTLSGVLWEQRGKKKKKRE